MKNLIISLIIACLSLVTYTQETQSREVHISLSGDDSTGNGSDTLPYYSFLKGLQSIDSELYPNAPITVKFTDGNYVFDWLPVKQEVSRLKIGYNAAIYVLGNATPFKNPFMLTPGNPDYYNYIISGETFIPNELIGKYIIFPDGVFEPVVSNTATTLQTNPLCESAIQAYSLGVTFTCSDLDFRGFDELFSGYYNPNISGANLTFEKINFIKPGTGTVHFATKNSITFYNCNFYNSIHFEDCERNLLFQNSAVLFSDASKPGITVNSDNIILSGSIVNKLNTRGSIGIVYNPNSSYYLNTPNAFSTYVGNTTTGVQFFQGNYTLTGFSLTTDATTALSLAKNTKVDISNLYLNNCTTVAAGFSDLVNTNLSINTIYGSYTNLVSSTLVTSGLCNLSKNIHVEIPGIPTSGTATLVNGTVAIPTKAVQSTSEIQLTCKTPVGTQGFLSVGTKTAGTSFVVNSSSATDSSIIYWQIAK